MFIIDKIFSFLSKINTKEELNFETMEKNYYDLPIADLLFITENAGYSEEAVQIVEKVLIERKKEIIQFFNDSEFFIDLLTIIVFPDPKKHHPKSKDIAIDILSDHKNEIIKYLQILNNLIKIFNDEKKEIVESLDKNISYLNSPKIRLEKLKLDYDIFKKDKERSESELKSLNKIYEIQRKRFENMKPKKLDKNEKEILLEKVKDIEFKSFLYSQLIKESCEIFNIQLSY